MAIIAKKFSLDSTPRVIGKGGSNNDPKTLVIKGASATIYVGGSTVDATEGLPITTTETLAIELGSDDTLYAMTATTATVQLLLTRASATDFGTEAS